MELVKVEPFVVVLAVTEADLAMLAEGLSCEAFLEVGASDGRYEHCMAAQVAFQGFGEALRLQGRVVDALKASGARSEVTA